MSFTLGAAAEVTVAVYDVLGRRVATLATGHQAAGRHTQYFCTSGYAPGLYHVVLVHRSGIRNQSLIVVR